mmetsp:Transcript_85973/g.271031  ORF Transcript_85973/g.271031 Transcript_85973/m.271031 type:complete len:274 (+) Transcript_85973:45-866(+)
MHKHACLPATPSSEALGRSPECPTAALTGQRLSELRGDGIQAEQCLRHLGPLRGVEAPALQAQLGLRPGFSPWRQLRAPALGEGLAVVVPREASERIAATWPRKHGPDEHAEAEHVGGTRVRTGKRERWLQDLRRRPACCASCRRRWAVWPCAAGRAQVANAGGPAAFQAPVHEDVVALDIEVREAGAMQSCQAPRRIRKQCQPTSAPELAPLHLVRKKSVQGLAGARQQQLQRRRLMARLLRHVPRRHHHSEQLHDVGVSPHGAQRPHLARS